MNFINIESTLPDLAIKEILEHPSWNLQYITDQTTEYFAVGLAKSQPVQALKSQYPNISSAGAVSIFRSLEQNTRLLELEILEHPSSSIKREVASEM